MLLILVVGSLILDVSIEDCNEYSWGALTLI
jgi:hypothetical protein